MLAIRSALIKAVVPKRTATTTMSWVRTFSVDERLQKMAENNQKLTESYGEIKGNFSKEEYDTIRRRRIIYRAKQRGWLEADILVGSWAKENVPRLTEDELSQLEIVLQEETIDLFNFVSGKDPLPEHLAKLPVMQQLLQYAKMTKIDDPESYAALKQRNNLI
jgi:succinate dehydrogenase assembly factor 2